MSEEAQSAIFERYNKSQNQANLGAGLGLAIVKKILELHDATIKVQSQLNKGTAFMFELPAFAG
jgi:signal transduction histidine kinase